MDVVQIIDSVSMWPVSVINTTSSRSGSMHAKLRVCIHMIHMDECIHMDDCIHMNDCTHMDECIHMDVCTEEFVSL